MNSFFKTTAVLGLVGASFIAGATTQETFTFTGVLSYAAPDTAVVETRTPSVTGYTLGRIQVDADCTETINTTGDFASENKIRLTSPSGLTTELSPFTTSGYTGTITSAPLNTYFFSSATIAGTWSFTFRNSFRDAPTSEADATVNATVRFTDEPITPPTATDLGNLTDSQSDYAVADMSGSSTGGAIKWFKFTTTTAFNPQTGRYIDFDVTGAATRGIGIYNAAGDLQGSTSTTSTTAVVKLLAGAETRRSATQNGNGWVGPLTTGGLQPGTYYVAICGTTATFTAGFGATSTATDTTPRTLEIRTNIAEALGSTAPTSTNLGTLVNPSNDYDVADIETGELAFGASEVKWYKLTLPEAITAASGKFLDIDTNEFSGISFDTEIAVYDSTGKCIGLDDDSGDGLESQLSWGDTTPRSVTGTTGLSASGQNGDLAAGDYYIAIGRYQTRFGSNWKAEILTTTAAGSAWLNIRTNSGSGGGGGGGVSGTLTLQDYLPGPGGRSVNFSLAQGGVVLETASDTLDLGGGYSFTTAMADGNYDLLIDAGRSWLTKKVSITISGGNATANASVTNGDVNNDGIVDIGDYSILAGAFDLFPGDPGYNAAADLNEDGFIDIADYTVLAGAFDLVDDVP